MLTSKLTGLLAASLLCGVSSTVRADDCRLNQITSLSVANTGTTMSVASGQLQGHTKRFLIDTGAQFNVISDHLARELSLDRSAVGTFAPVIVDGETLVEVTRNGRMQLDHAQFDPAQFFISHRSELVHPNFDGILGSQFLSNFDLDLDLSQRKIGLFAKDHCEGKVVYWASEYLELPITIDHYGRILFDVEVDGKKLKALLDTGSEQTMMESTVADGIFDVKIPDAEPSGARLSRVAGRVVRSHAYSFKTLSFGGITIRNPDLVIGDNRAEAGAYVAGGQLVSNANIPDIFLGMNYIKLLHIYVSTNESKLYFTPAGSS